MVVAAEPRRISCWFPFNQSTVIDVEVARTDSWTRIELGEPRESAALGEVVAIPIPRFIVEVENALQLRVVAALSVWKVISFEVSSRFMQSDSSDPVLAPVMQSRPSPSVSKLTPFVSRLSEPVIEIMEVVAEVPATGCVHASYAESPVWSVPHTTPPFALVKSF